MKTIFENLHLYEIVLLFLGVFLFMILCAALVYYVIKKDDIKKLLYFFIIPIIMIAYPSIQEIRIEKDKLALIKYKNQVEENPNDSNAIIKLATVAKKLEKRATSTEDLAAVTKAFLLLENPDKAIELADKAIAKETEEMTMTVEAPSDEKTETTKDAIKPAINIASLKGIREYAVLQRAIKSDSTLLQDTVKLKKRINNISTVNSKTRQYFNKKYLLRTRTNNTLKQ